MVTGTVRCPGRTDEEKFDCAEPCGAAAEAESERDRAGGWRRQATRVCEEERSASKVWYDEKASQRVE